MKRHNKNRVKLYFALIAITGCFLHGALAYPTGNMSCRDIGEFAAATVVGKQNGATLKEALAKVDKATADYPTERKNLTQIVRAIYTAEWAKHFTDEGARAAFAAECEALKND
jgi:hypothetical protein